MITQVFLGGGGCWRHMSSPLNIAFTITLKYYGTNSENGHTNPYK